jgi:uncharacterized protein (DUF433 family)
MEALNSDQSSVVHSDPEIMHGAAVFRGTRVPVQNLFDYIEAGDPLVEFLDQFPSVSRDQAVAALEEAAALLVDRGPPIKRRSPTHLP